MTELVKHFVDRAEGFELVNNIGIEYKVNGAIHMISHFTNMSDSSCWDYNKWHDLYLSIFLQKVIEGVNRDYRCKYAIIQFPGTVDVVERTEDMDPVVSYTNFNGLIDQAKIAALTWIMEQERQG